jgi:hypothetical protein
MATTEEIMERVANVKKATVCSHSPAATPPAKSVTSVMMYVRQPTMKSNQALIDTSALKMGGISNLKSSVYPK